jgi:hypothetical protein
MFQTYMWNVFWECVLLFTHPCVTFVLHRSSGFALRFLSSHSLILSSFSSINVCMQCHYSCHTANIPHCHHTTLPSHHTAITPHCQHTTLPSHHTAITPHCHHTTLPSHHTAITPHSLHTTLPSHHTATTPYCHHNTLPSHHTALS